MAATQSTQPNPVAFRTNEPQLLCQSFGIEKNHLTNPNLPFSPQSTLNLAELESIFEGQWDGEGKKKTPKRRCATLVIRQGSKIMMVNVASNKSVVCKYICK